MSAGCGAPAARRRVITVVGISCKLALSSASSIASARRPTSPWRASRLAARIPAGVAALPRPRTLAERFTHIADQHSSSSRPGNRGFANRLKTFPILFRSPVSSRISISPHQTGIAPSSVSTSFTASSPLVSTASSSSCTCPPRSPTNTDAAISAIQIFCILLPLSATRSGSSPIMLFIYVVIIIFSCM